MGLLTESSYFDRKLIMISKISILMCVAIALTFGMINTSEAYSNPDPTRMQQHIDKVKISHPKEYQDMLNQAGGNIKDCLSCHKGLQTKQNPSSYNLPRYPRHKR